MSERYRLVFRGEVLDGQHPAVVKKKLGRALQLQDERLEALFSGKVVIVKKDADTSTAARYQALFKKTGARLRILPVDAAAPGPHSQGAASADSRTPASLPGNAPASAEREGPELLPPGSDVLRDDERTKVEPVDVNTSHLQVQGAVFSVADPPASEAAAPDVGHLSLAEVGEDLGPDAAPDTAPLDLSKLNFEVADVGVDMDQRPRQAPPPAPDTNHLDLAADGED